MEMHKHQDSISSLFYHTKQRSTRQRIASDERVKDWGAPGVGGYSYSGLYGEALPERGGENCHFSIQIGHKISCKVEEMAAKEVYQRVPHFGRNDYAAE